HVDVCRFWPNEAESVVGSIHVFVQEGVNAQETRRAVTELFMHHIDGLKEICVQIESVHSARLTKKETPYTPYEANAHNINFRSTLLPQPTFAATIPIEHHSAHSSPALLPKSLKKKD
ncbi:hypothetical protein EDC96DRAFT_577406, partial [Choanephora cucurbitarum]